MTTRQFTQYAQGYGINPATVTVTLDGTIIFDGSIPTVDQPLPSLPDLTVDLPQAFDWEGTMEFSGQIPMTISVQGADIYLGGTVANTWIGNAWVKFSFFEQEIGGQPVLDPFTEVEIDGVALTRPNTPDGQWWWLIHAGSEFQAILNITASPLPTEEP